MTPTRLVLIRHGESAAQEGGYLAGHGCTGLSDLGRSQARALADRLAEGELGSVDALYCSEMARARETASILAPAVGAGDPIADCTLCELHPGAADGLTWAEIEQRWPTRHGDGFDPDAITIDGAETWAAMRGRVRGALDRLAADHAGRTVVVACHGGVVAQAVQHHLGIAADLDPVAAAEVAWLVADNTSITELVLDPAATGWRAGRWGLVRFNDAAHLRGLRAG